MKKLFALLSGVLLLSACSGEGNSGHEPVIEETPHMLAVGFDHDTVRGQPFMTEDESGTGFVVEGQDIIWATGGSGSCPPTVDTIEFIGTGDSIDEMEVTMAMGEGACTADYVPYAITITVDDDFVISGDVSLSVSLGDGETLDIPQVTEPTAPPETEEPVIGGEGFTTSTSIYMGEEVRQVGDWEVVNGESFKFFIAGSGSCPPVVEDVDVTVLEISPEIAQVTVTLGTSGEYDVCTDDYIFYEVDVVLEDVSWFSGLDENMELIIE